MTGIAAEVRDNGSGMIGIGDHETLSRMAVAAIGVAGGDIRVRRGGRLIGRIDTITIIVA